ncbi:hypothetical protein [Peribacillus sp. NPDC056705]|uniref:hypothetical protein n=1 Tax=Peribacillus sp. NPDC056705 TaxID=3345918 RepID=UPI003749AD15
MQRMKDESFFNFTQDQFLQFGIFHYNMDFVYRILYTVLMMIDVGGYITYVKTQKFDKITLLIESSEGVRL